MRGCFRLVRVLIIIVVLIALGVGAYWAVTSLPDLQRVLRDNFNITIGTASPDLPTPITDPTEIAALPTSIPPETPVPVTLPPTPAGCVAAAAVEAGGEQVRRERPGRGQERAEQRRNVPQGRRVDVVAPRERIPNRVLIEFTPESSRRERAAYIRSIGGQARRNIDRLNTVVVRLPQNVEPSSLPSSPIVVSVSADHYVSAVWQSVNDPLFADQWALPVIGASAVWPAIPDNTPPVTVAVIDSGVCLNHPDLAGKFVAGWDFVEDDDLPQDDFGHGCGVAGVIAANGNNGIGIAGIAPNARIMPLRVLDAQGLGSFSDVAAAIIYATDSGAQIINLSLAGPSTAPVVEDAVNYATSRGVMIIASAGNAGVETVWYPAAYPAVIAVGSVDQTLERSSFSNYGAGIDIVAPGRDIYTTSVNGDYMTMTGTSFAAPQVTGIAALARAFNTFLSADGGVVFISPPENTAPC